MKFATMCAGLALLSATGLGLAACDRSDPPVKKLERAAEDTITEIEGETLPRQAQGPFAPRDECTDQPGAPEFLASLRRAVRDRDADALSALAADDIKLDFGGGGGRALLAERMADPQLALWDELDQILTLGCASDGATMTLPWYFAQETDGDPYSALIVMGEDVPLRDMPDSDSETVTTLSWGRVDAIPEATPAEGFRHVRWTDPATGRPTEGYIATDNLRALIDYRLMASRRNDRWSIVNFVAGD